MVSDHLTINYLIYINRYLIDLYLIYIKLHNARYLSDDNIKDIVQPKKRGVKMGINRFISTSYTIADAF
jgi:hypothetical protein